MEYFGKGLYLIFFALVFWFIHRLKVAASAASSRTTIRHTNGSTTP